jgi:hypothetical protein
MFITENTEANFVYNVLAAWMGQDPNSIKIQVCKTGQPKEGMAHILEAKDHLWDGIYNFKLFKATVRKKRSKVPNYQFIPEDNINIIVNLMTDVMQLSVNRFLKLSSLKKIIREKFLKKYNKSPVFEDEMALPYPDDMKIEMFCGNKIQGYLLDQKMLSVKINYGGGSFKGSVRNYQTIEKLTKKMCEMYSLGKDVIITVEEGRVYSSKIIPSIVLKNSGYASIIWEV